MFEEGGFVKCIDNTDYEGDLTIGKIYKIKSLQNDLISIIDNAKHLYCYRQYRFKAVNLLEMRKLMIFKQFKPFNV